MRPPASGRPGSLRTGRAGAADPEDAVGEVTATATLWRSPSPSTPAARQLPARNLMATAFELTAGRVLADVAGRAMGSWPLGLDDPEEVVETFAVWLTTTMRLPRGWRWSGTSWAWRNRRKP